jgi:hypothetical protein
MKTQDRFDDLIGDRLRADAPREAPGRLLDATMNRIADTPQRGGGWLAHPGARLLAAAAVLLLAVVAGTQLASLIGRPAGDGPSPSPSVAPSASPSTSPSASAAVPSPSASAEPSASAVADDTLVLRVESGGGGPTYPSQNVPWLTLMGDGTLIWQTVPPPEQVDGSLITRTLTEQGLADFREQIFGSGLLDASANHELEPLPGVSPPGRGVGVYVFTAEGDDGQVVVRSLQWLGDEEEATWYQPSPERRELDALAQRLRDPESLLGTDAWAGPAEPYAGTAYLLWLTPNRDVPPFDTADASEIPLPFDGPLDDFGEESGSQPPVTRCGAISRDEAAAIVDALASLGYEGIGLDGTTTGSLDWAEGNGTVDLAILPVMPDGYPECLPVNRP